MQVRVASFDLSAFNCPHCKAYAQQCWHRVGVDPLKNNATPGDAKQARENAIAQFVEASGAPRLYSALPGVDVSLNIISEVITSCRLATGIYISHCAHCSRISVWHEERLVIPSAMLGPPKSPDLPLEMHQDYNEANSVLQYSPRASAALLRLIIEKLCIMFGGTGKNLSEDIGLLVKKGLDSQIQQSLDIVRFIGNSAVHPGKLDIRDDNSTALILFNIVNIIVDALISRPKQISALYEMLPENERQKIERRDR